MQQKPKEMAQGAKHAQDAIHGANAATAQQSIGAQFGRGEITSNTGQPYADYYGGWYDQTFPPKKK